MPVNTPVNCNPYLIPWGVGRTEFVNPENRIEAHPQITLEATEAIPEATTYRY